MMIDTAVIIVNWNGEKHLADCFAGLRNQTERCFRVIFVDNGSTDNSIETAKREWPDVYCISLEKNTGFSFANNMGIAMALQDPAIQWVITLNNDTKAESEYLKEIIACAKKHPEAGSIQPKVVNFFDSERIDSAGVLIACDMSAINRGQREKDEGQFDAEAEIFGSSASAALYRRESLEKTALSSGEYFDNSYFAYYEDVDLAWRLRLAGYSSWYAPKARVLHVHSATGIDYSPFKAFHIHRNQYYNIIKDLPFWLMIRALALMPVRYILLLTSAFRKKGASAKLVEGSGPGAAFRIVFRSWFETVKNVPLLIKKRRIIQQLRTVSDAEVNNWFRKYRADWRRTIFG